MPLARRCVARSARVERDLVSRADRARPDHADDDHHNCDDHHHLADDHHHNGNGHDYHDRPDHGDDDPYCGDNHH